jgi:hypothetical protein
VGEAREASAVEVDGEGLVGGAEGVDAHVELAPSEEERVEQVALADVGLRRVVAVEALPLRNVPNLVEDENALPLALAGLRPRTGTGFMIHSVLLSFCVFLNSS